MLPSLASYRFRDLSFNKFSLIALHFFYDEEDRSKAIQKRLIEMVPQVALLSVHTRKDAEIKRSN